MRRAFITLAVTPLLVALAAAPSSAGVFPGDDGAIAFSRPSGIWTVDPDGANAELVIPDAFSPDWSPDGTQVTYVRFGPDFADVFVADADGSNEVRITSWGENLTPTFSADGASVIWVRSGGRADLVSKAADGTGARTRLTDTPRLHEFSPSASPDGASITFSAFRGDGDLDVYTIDAAGGNQQRITSSRHDDFDSSWSPDSQRIAFTRIGANGRWTDVFAMDADGSDVERLTRSPRSDSTGTFSPSGTRLVIVRCCWGSRERPRLALIDADGSNLTPLVRHGFDPDWQAVE